MKTTPLLSWDLSGLGYFNTLKELQKKQDLSTLKSFASKYKWENEIDQILLNNTYEALVLTDLTRNILWVNDGFTEMTGYTKNNALRNTPSFLQTKETSQESKDHIRKKLRENKPFKAIIVNKKKDNTLYKCELHIFPLTYHKTTHFLALEKQIA
ncbi:PAS domain-containing protein [Flavobacteriaceae bacterium S356]|uniref:PAS domain-containing protein n=1 Tax=Asprobacillus argus TaxID=3076534 RepID=A0ABU3LEQ6_9FLAO|nr:PAS domain-containing protein [Flavobacteriaceae bacterium S356]